ncbi:MAG TPA: hypothetical protein VLI90_09770, partial [Tepidisphaeraceae bacterium]|nr:hypothetical protein [Tepidisphaeraceae bacterium]
MRRKNHIEELEARRLLSVSASSLFVFTTGTKLTYQITSSGNTATSTTTVKGAATFNGHNAIEIDGTTSNVAGTSKSFVGLDGAGNAVSYGSSGTTAGGSFTDTNTPPAINFPATMNAGTTYTENWGTHDVFAGGTSDSTTVHTVKLTSASLVSVAVPAGTFNAYLFNETDTITAGGFTLPTSTIQQWIVPNKGLVKSVITSSGNTTTEVLIPNNVVVGPAAKLLIAQQPTTGKPGVALTPAIKVNVTDANGNIVTGNTSTVA